MSVIDDELEATSLGTQVAPHFVDLPIGEASPVVRLHQVTYSFQAHRETGRAVAANRLAGIAGFAPTTFHALGSRVAAAELHKGFHLSVTNVPGPQFPLYAAGAMMLETYPVHPLLPGHALAIGVTSYDGGVYYGLTADRDLLPDVDTLGECLTEALDELDESTGDARPRAPRGRARPQGRQEAGGPLVSVRVYVPTTLDGLAQLADDGELPASPDAVVAPDDDEETEYDAMMTAAGLVAGPGRRVVVVAEVGDPDGPVRLDQVVAVHADSERRRRARRRPGVVRRHRDPGGARPRVRSVARRNTVARMDAITTPPAPVNEPNLSYAPGTPERAELTAELERQERRQHSLRAYINGRRRNGGGAEIKVVQPHDHQHVLGVMKNSTTARRRGRRQGRARRGADVARDAVRRASCAIILKAADLLAGPWRQRLNAATMLGQSKTAFQAEIDAACELIDFWRFNVHYAKQIHAEQPIANSPGVWNRTDHRPLEGFVYAITPFNFTAIAGNLPTAPALMGNTVVWKPSPTQQLAASLTMDLLEEAGLPPGVINMLPGDGLDVSKVALTHPDLAGIHFTGSTPTFQHLWRTVGENIASYRSYPRIVGETGGKDFVIAHPSADPDVLRVALIRGAFEFQGQKCSAASRAYVARSVWDKMRDPFLHEVENITMGDVTDFSNFMGAVIDDRAFAKHKAALARVLAQQAPHDAGRAARPTTRSATSCGPTVVQSTDPTDQMFSTEYFGPILAVHVYPDAQYDRMLRQMESFAPYALTGAIIAQDRRAIADARRDLRFAAGNFYINDKPTGAVVGQQPFGGARASGTNDKAGAAAEPDALDVAALDQGDVRPAEGLPLPAHGMTVPLHFGALHPFEQALTLLLAFGPSSCWVVVWWRRRVDRGGRW